MEGGGKGEGFTNVCSKGLSIQNTKQQESTPLIFCCLVSFNSILCRPYHVNCMDEALLDGISPNCTLPFAALTIGFNPIQYAVNESYSYVTFNVSILGGATIQGASVGVMFSTGDGTALGK